MEGPIWVAGAMSGTSLDGVDAALIQTDGQRIFAFDETLYRAYSAQERAVLRAGLGQWHGQAGVADAAEVVETAHAGAARAAIEMGPLAVDVYTRDMDASIARLDDAGVEHGHVGTLDLGALVMRQCEVIAPDGWRLVLVEANHRRPSILDDDPDRLHSEVHSVLWTVPSIADATPGLTAFGLTQAHVFPIRHPELARIISLPAPDTEMTMNLLVDDAESPIRVELCEFADHPGAPAGPGPLRGGIHAIAFGESTRATTQTFASGVRIER